MKSQLPKGFASEIDLLRGMFAGLVVLGHAIDISILSSSRDIFYEVLIRLRGGLGFVWVIGFVVLSGYCIELSCMKRKIFSAPRYFAQRVTRIFPLLIVCVAIAGLIEWNIANSPDRPKVWQGKTGSYFFLINLLGAGGFLGQFGSIAPAYTISYELLYYAVWGISRTVAGERVQLALVMNFGFALAYVMLPAEYIGEFPTLLGALLKQFILLIYLPWLIGAGTAIYLTRLAANQVVRRIASFGWFIVFLVVLIGGKAYRMPAFETTYVSLTYYLLLGFSFSLLIIRAKVLHVESFEAKWKRLLGEISYPLFLVHGPIIILVGYLTNSHAIALPFIAHLLLLLIAAFVAASVLLVTVERPVMRLRSEYFTDPRPAIPATVSLQCPGDAIKPASPWAESSNDPAD